MSTFIDFLIEMASSVVYHYTDIISALSICGSNEFRLSSSLGTNAEETMKKGSKSYYLSTTRHKLGGFNLEPHTEGIMFVLDGTKLNQRFETKPVDYWGHEFRKLDPKKAESEDRLFHSKQTIPDARSYVKEVHILFMENKFRHRVTPRNMRRLLICLKKNDIPHWVYDNKRAFLLQDKRRSTTLEKEMLKSPGKEEFYPLRMKTYARSETVPWIELYHKSNKEQLSKEASDMLYNLQYHDYRGDMTTALQNAIHNYRNDPKYGKVIERISDIIRKEKLGNVQQFVDFIKKKWGIEVR